MIPLCPHTQAVMAKKLKPGMSIPGCNSYFLCKYLKDTMLQVIPHPLTLFPKPRPHPSHQA